MAASSDETGVSRMRQVFQTDKTLMRKEAFKSRKAELELTARPVAPAEPPAVHTASLCEALSEVSS